MININCEEEPTDVLTADMCDDCVVIFVDSDIVYLSKEKAIQLANWLLEHTK